MSSSCSYCGGLLEDGASRCDSCGAPLAGEAANASDYRSCPFCRRKLLALASPSCSYCGRRLPKDYIEAREADLRRIAEIRSDNTDKDVNGKVGELIRQSLREGREDSLLDILNIGNITDLLS